MSVEAEEESFAVDMRHHSVVVSYVLAKNASFAIMGQRLYLHIGKLCRISGFSH